ncbi:MAG TPA: single-stranded DNA-binding protein [Patescibacteria group bacterium]|nr:single-stranded DNA-binding protein [Patescibacteria group bacterium]
MNLNKVSLLGNLTRDPLDKKSRFGTDIALFTVATNYVYKDQKTGEKKETVEFHPIIAWGKLAQIVNKYLTKGSKVYLEGRLHTRNWEDKDKKVHYKTEVIANELIMLGGGSKREESKTDELAEEEISVEEVPVEED